MNVGRIKGWFLGLVLILAGTPSVAGSPPEATSDWQSRAFAEIQAREYDVTWQQDGWQAPNRAHSFRTTFTDAGMRITPRLEEQASWEWGLSLIRYGRPGAKVEVESAALSPAQNRLNRTWNGITEWYVNDPRGLEHGFDLAQKPEGRGDVQLDLALSGALHPSFSEDGQSVDFRIPGGASVLHYAKLVVVDARGRTLPARMEGFGGGIRLVFDDTDAVYPVTVDPLATSSAWSADGNQVNSFFGTLVATAGDVNGDGYSDVIVGADRYDNGQTDEGRAFLYLGQPSGVSPTAAWTAESNQASAFFGRSVAAAGDVNGDGFGDVIVGCPRFDDFVTDMGRAYVYYGSASGLPATASLTLDGSQNVGAFGDAVGTAGDINADGYADVIVGAPTEDNGQGDEGRAHIYYGSAAGLSDVPDWTLESNHPGAFFGDAVGTAGDVNADGYADVIIGAPFYDVTFADSGRAYVYLGSSSGLAGAPVWTASSVQASARFGQNVGTAGDVNGDGFADVIVGCPLWDNGQADEGRALVYLGSAGGPQAAAAWSVESDQAAALLGTGVATAGDINGDGYADVVVGAPDFNRNTEGGRAWVYFGSSTGLATTASWTGNITSAAGGYGTSVGTAGDVNGDGYSDVIVGAPLAGSVGRAFVFLGLAAGPATTENWTIEGNAAGLNAGYVVASAGDVNGDGYSDVLVGGNHFKASLFLGSASGLGTTADWTATHPLLTSFGSALASAGDVNGDGYSDVIIGASETTGPGNAYVYLGSSSGLSATAAWTVQGQNTSRFGISVASAGDVNGDGYSDVIVGAPWHNNGEAAEGRAYVYLGSATGLSTTAAWIVESNMVNGRLGSAVASAGDVNGDGYSDVIVGAPLYFSGTDGGRAFVYLGSASGLSTTYAWWGSAVSANASYGRAVASAGDVNGDGYSDIAVGSSVNGGRVTVHYGSATGPTVFPPDVTINREQQGFFFGDSVASAGDVNGDGYSDLIVGDPGFASSNGKAYVYLGSASGLATSPAWSRAGVPTNSDYGFSVASAGDVNGDGVSDILAGSPRFANAETNEGLVHLFYGNGARCRAYAPQQLRANATALIQLLGKSEAADSFRLVGKVWSAAGRSKVRLQWEAKAVGTPFTGTGLGLGSTIDANPAMPVYYNELADGLTGATAYRWRARLVGDSVFFPRSRWISPPGNGRTEADLRTAPACIDIDGDGYGTNGGTSCPGGPQADCQDGNPAIHPGATEACDGIDNNCNGAPDDVTAVEVCDGVDNNCNGVVDDVPGPAGSPFLRVFKTSFVEAQVIWTPLDGATQYEMVRGALMTLRISGGNYTSAIDQCGSTPDQSATSVGVPNPGDGYFFLVRGSASCAHGTFDSGAPAQSGSRDAEIAASPATCP